MRVARVTREYLGQAALLIAVLALIFPGAFLRGERLIPGAHFFDQAPWTNLRPVDLPDQNPLGREVPTSVCVWFSATNRAFEQGEWPLWSPLQFTGSPLLATFQASVFYPPRLLFRIVDDVWLAATLYILLKFWLCGFNAFVCARVIGLRPASARFFSIAYMLAGYCLLWCYYPPPDVMAWFPYAFVGAEYLLEERNRRGFHFLAFGTTLMILPGHPSSLLMAHLGIGCYVLLRLAAGRASRSRFAVCGTYAAGAMSLALAVCAVQILPFLEYLRHSELFIDRLVEDGVQHYTYSISSLLSMWMPRIMGTEFERTFWGKTNHTYLGMLYAGIPVWVGVLLLLGRLNMDATVRARIRALLAVSSLFVFLALDLPILETLHRLPVLSGVRPAYYIAFAAFAFPLAASLSYQTWMESPDPLRSLRKPVIAASALAILLGVAFLILRAISPAYAATLEERPDLPWYVARQGLFALAVAAVSFLTLTGCAVNRARLRCAMPVLCIVLAGDHAAGIHRLLSTTPSANLFPDTELTHYLQNLEKPARVRFDVAGVIPGYAPLYGIEELFGYDAVYPKRFAPLFDSLNLLPEGPVAPVLACRLVLFPEHVPLPTGFKALATLDHLQVAEDTRAVPRARLVGHVKEFDSSDAMYEYMNGPGFDPAAVVWIDQPTGIQLPESTGASPGDARISKWSWNAVTIEANAQKDCVLVLADAFYTGWHAYVDGKEVEIFPAYHLLRGVVLPKGSHVVEFRFSPASFRYGLMISIVALVASCLISTRVIFASRKKKGRTSQSEPT